MSCSSSGIHRDRIALIHVARGKLGLSERAYRGLLWAVAGVSSSKDLTDTGFAAMMNEFRRLGFESTAAKERREEFARPSTHATLAQRRLMQLLWDQWKGCEDPAGLRRWLSSHFHVSHLKFCARETAPKVIAALRKFKQERAPSVDTSSTRHQTLSPSEGPKE